MLLVDELYVSRTLYHLRIILTNSFTHVRTLSPHCIPITSKDGIFLCHNTSSLVVSCCQDRFRPNSFCISEETSYGL